MKQKLLENISIFLLNKGFTIKSLKGICFDLLARKEDKILLLKILEDANSIPKEFAVQMKNISSYINGVPLIIADKAGGLLENNVVYLRFDIYTLNPQTFKSCIENKLPFIKSNNAGLTACIDGNKLKKKIEEAGVSLNALSRKVGVSARMFARYEDGSTEITLNKAYRLYDIFGEEVFKKIDILSEKKELIMDTGTDITKKYSDLGFNATETKKSPFDVIAKKDREIILTEVGDKSRPELTSLSKLIDADRLAIFNKKKPKNLPALTVEEFLDFEKASELIKFLKEYEE